MFELGRELLRNWFDSVELQLRTEAERAGIFKHASITGSAREEVVRKVLRDILPRSIEVGSGRVIGADCRPSKQIDIVVFDGRFPVLRMGDEALYPIEGVIATIEVKSELTTAELEAALANAASVMQISASFVKEDADEWRAKREAAGATEEQSLEELTWQLIPRTYVFAFRGLLSRSAQSDAFRDALGSGFQGTRTRPFIPSVIAGGAAVTIAVGNTFTIRLDDPQQQQEIDQKGIAVTVESPCRFGILVSHLLMHLEQRTLMLEPSATIRRVLQSYLPFGEYINDCLRDKPHSWTLWHERTMWAYSPGSPTLW